METAIAPVDATAFERKALAVLDAAKKLTVTNDEEFELAGKFLRGLKDYQKELDATFDPAIKKQREALEAQRQAKARHAEPILEAEHVVKGKLSDYQVRLDRQAREEELRRQEDTRKAEEDRRLAEAEALEKEGRPAEAEAILSDPAPPLAPVPALPAPRIEGVSFRDKWDGRVIDLRILIEAVAAKKAPISLLKADETALRQFAQATKGAVEVPGVRFTRSQVVASRGSE